MLHRELLVLGPVARVRAARVGHRREGDRSSPTRPRSRDHSVSSHVLTDHEHLETVLTRASSLNNLSVDLAEAGRHEEAQRARQEVRLIDLDPARGADANNRRPAVIVSNDTANTTATRLGRGVLAVAPVTSNVERV